MTKILFPSYFLYLFFTLCLLSPQARAGGPLVVNSSGVAVGWDNGSAIVLTPDSGSCATFSNGDMLEKLQANVAQWENIDGILLSFLVDLATIGEDIDIDNYTDYLVVSSTDPGLTDDLNPVIFDDDGSIVSEVFGSGNEFAVLGFANPDSFDSEETQILDGQALFNCLCLDGNDNISACEEVGVSFSEDDLDFTMVHEIGHMIGLDHTQVNQAMAEGTDCDVSTADDCTDIPAMYPVSVDPADQLTPSRDDEVMALTLYGDTNWENDFCTVTGVLHDASGNDLRCVDVQAVTTDTADSIAVVSGAFASATDVDGDGYTDRTGECATNCGAFTLRGLDPTKTYTIKVKAIDPQWIAGSGIGPCSTQLTGIVNEDIGTITSCAAATVEDLGTIETTSTPGATTAGTDGTTSTGACGEGQDFTTCSSLASCSLTHQSQDMSARSILFSLFFLVCFNVMLKKILRGFVHNY